MGCEGDLAQNGPVVYMRQINDSVCLCHYWEASGFHASQQIFLVSIMLKWVYKGANARRDKTQPVSPDTMEDPHIQYSFETFSGLHHRSIIPLLTHPNHVPTDTGELPDLNNVQGDIIYLFPKVSPLYYISDIQGFTLSGRQRKFLSSLGLKT